MVLTGSAQVEDAFTQFIGLMKYMYANNTKDKIPVCTEVDYIRQYIGLQKYRIPRDFQIHFSYHHDETDQMGIVPMILITFVENVFKHGVSSQHAGEAFVDIRMEKGELLFSTRNPLLNHHRSNSSKGIGIENCRKRLDLLYPGRYTLMTGAEGEEYVVTLSLALK